MGQLTASDHPTMIRDHTPCANNQDTLTVKVDKSKASPSKSKPIVCPSPRPSLSPRLNSVTKSSLPVVATKAKRVRRAPDRFSHSKVLFDCDQQRSNSYKFKGN